MPPEIKVLGTLKGASYQSKLDSNDRPVHTLTLKIELMDGHKDAQNIGSHLSQVMQVVLEAKQPSLG